MRPSRQLKRLLDSQCPAASRYNPIPKCVDGKAKGACRPVEDGVSRDASYYMYVVECADGTWYTGYTTDVERRVATHNAGKGARYTKVRRPVTLLASALFATKHEAMSAEYHFKRLSRSAKESLVAAASEEAFERVLGRVLGVGADSAGAAAGEERETVVDERETIRTGTLDDVDALAALEAACFPPAEAASAEQFAERLAAFPDHFWLLERDGELVAAINGMVTNESVIADEMFADATLHVEDGAWQAIFGVETAPEHRRQGYAARLMEHVIAEARAQGRRGCVLTCKEPLIHYYERFGYVSCGLSASEHGGAQWYDMRIEF